MSSRFSEYISEQVVLKGLSCRLYFENRRDFSFTGALKTRVVLFQKLLKMFSKIKSTNRALCNLWI